MRGLYNKVNHPFTKIECLSVTETAAEKWVALTRRISSITHKESYYDPNLVRQLYDIYFINKNDMIDDNFIALTHEIIDFDKKMFKSHNNNYFNDPLSEIKKSLVCLQEDKSWKNNWDKFVKSMVFDKNAPYYDEALNLFSDLSDKIIQAKNG